MIVEPVAANMGLVLPVDGFLRGLRSVCDRHGALLIFDEVITGFRVALGGAQTRFGVTPDLTTFGKVIGGGLPGRRLRRPARADGAHRAGRAGLPGGHALGQSARDGGRARGARARGRSRASTSGSSAGTTRLAEGLARLAREAGDPLTASALGGLFGFFFHAGPVRSYADAQKSDTRASRASSTPCSSAACTSRRRRSRPAS